MNVLKRIKELMNMKGWSEYRLAKEAELPQSTISHLFKRNNAPSYPTIDAICRAFGITLSHFFAEDGDSMSLSSEQHELLLLYGALTDEQKELIISTMLQFGRKTID
jgi:Predicted transcriptional regulators